jgi:hypothetical protein
VDEVRPLKSPHSALESIVMLALNRSSLGFGYSVSLTILGLTLNAQTPETPQPVPLKDEPHYRLIFENTYVRVFRTNLLGHTATLTHRHDLPYVYVTIGPADFIDALTDKAEVHMVMTDGQVGYSQGGFAHVIRTEAGSPLDLVIIELLKSQGEPQNACEENQIVPGPSAEHCSKTLTDRSKGSAFVPLFDTDQTHVRLEWYDSIQIGPTYRLGTLMVVLSGSGIQRVEKGKPEETLSVGSAAWLVAESPYTFINQSGKPWSYLSLSFEGTEPLRPEWKPGYHAKNRGNRTAPD